MTGKVKYKSISKNRRSFYDYDIKRRLIAGIVLTGPEAKSIRNGTFSLMGSFADFRKGELWINNLHITKYPNAAYSASYNPNEARKLLLHRNELKRIVADKQNGMHIVVLSIGVMGKYIKAELGVGLSKKKYDKRQSIKARSQLKEVRRAQSKINYH